MNRRGFFKVVAVAVAAAFLPPIRYELPAQTMGGYLVPQEYVEKIIRRFAEGNAARPVQWPKLCVEWVMDADGVLQRR